MFQDDGIVERSIEDMRLEMETLLKESNQNREESYALLEESKKVRSKSIELRSANPDMAESLWEEAEQLFNQSKNLYRDSVDKMLKASDIKHRIEVHDQIEATIDHADDLWKGAIKARRS